MGQLFPNYGCCVPSQNPNVCYENHAQVKSTPLRRKRSNLSAAFNFSEIAADRCTGGRVSDLINVNVATEEELMTLSGVNRQVAANIVAYRHQIGAFRRVEDLVLVSGIGATRLGDIRGEICVIDRVNSHSSSTSSGRVELDDVISRNCSCPSHHRSGSKVRVNINLANIFQLMKIKGMTQAMAENIVSYREHKGQFSNIDELIHVKGMKPLLLNSFKPYVVLHDNGYGGNSNTNGEVPRLDKSVSDARLILSPLDLCPIRAGVPSVKMASASMLRFATWNLDHCGLEKIGNPGVREVVAMTILENGIKLLALQDIKCGLVLQMLCDELNTPTLHNVKSWSHPRGRWKSVVPPSSSTSNKVRPSLTGFMFDSSFSVRVSSNSQLTCCSSLENDLAAICFVADFMIDRLEISFANFCISNETVKTPEFSSWKELVKAVEEKKSGNKLIFAGGLGTHSNNQARILDVFEKNEYHTVIPKNVYTDITRSNLIGSKHSENIWLNPRASYLFQGFSSVVREGLTSPWIPDGWSWGGLVSSHCPVIADFSPEKKFSETAT